MDFNILASLPLRSGIRMESEIGCSRDLNLTRERIGDLGNVRGYHEEYPQKGGTASIVLAIIGSCIIGLAAFMNLFFGLTYDMGMLDMDTIFIRYAAESMFWVGVALFGFAIVVAIRK